MQKTMQRTTFSTPFSLEYWRLAAGEFKDFHMLVLAAVITALRIAIKAFSIPIGPNLNFTFGFLFNALGSAIYGPVVGLLGGAVSDTVGALLFPKGDYFFPYIFSEMMGSFLFGLFLYRSKVTSTRIILSRFAVTLACPLMLDRFIMYWQNTLILGKPFKILSLPQIIKNLATFPLQCVMMLLFFGALIPIMRHLKIMDGGGEPIKIQKKDIILIVILTVIAVAAILFYYQVYIPNKANFTF